MPKDTETLTDVPVLGDELAVLCPHCLHDVGGLAEGAEDPQGAEPRGQGADEAPLLVADGEAASEAVGEGQAAQGGGAGQRAELGGRLPTEAAKVGVLEGAPAPMDGLEVGLRGAQPDVVVLGGGQGFAAGVGLGEWWLLWWLLRRSWSATVPGEEEEEEADEWPLAISLKDEEQGQSWAMREAMSAARTLLRRCNSAAAAASRVPAAVAFCSRFQAAREETSARSCTVSLSRPTKPLMSMRASSSLPVALSPPPPRGITEAW